MFLIEEFSSRRNVFNKYIVDKDKRKKDLIQTIEVKCMHKSIDNHEYTILYDSNMVPIRDAFKFINTEFVNNSPNSKAQAISALRLLYSYLELFNLRIENLSDIDIKRLKYFLKGFSPKGELITLNLTTDRSNETINTYLAVYRKYAEFLGISGSNLLKVRATKTKLTIAGSDVAAESKSYVHKEKTVNKKTVPRYISCLDYKKILDVIKKDYTSREQCIIRLMYEGGLRIGEVLGLTAEDVKVEEFLDKKTGETFESGVIYIRNRVTDKSYQLAKRRPVITDKKSYRYKFYKDTTQKVYVSLDLIDLIDTYIEDEHDSSNRNTNISQQLFDKNYKKYTLTDIVDKKTYVDSYGDEIKENYYVFINSIGKPINISTWNKTLREIFEKSGLSTDNHKKEHNLSHRFRHGFAMFLVQYKNIRLEELKLLMRHESLSSTAIYYRPTEDDVATIKEDFSKTLEELIPMITD